MAEDEHIDLPMFEPGTPIDVAKHEGKRAKIAIIETIDSFSDYDIKNQHVPGLRRPVKKLKVSTEVLETIQREGKPALELRASMLFGLKEKATGSKTVWGVSKDPKSKIWQFMKKQNVTLLEQLKGTLVTVTTVPSKKPGDNRRYLGFAI